MAHSKYATTTAADMSGVVCGAGLRASLLDWLARVPACGD